MDGIAEEFCGPLAGCCLVCSDEAVIQNAAVLGAEDAGHRCKAAHSHAGGGEAEVVVLELGEGDEFFGVMKLRREFEAGGTGLFGEGGARGKFLQRGESFEVVKRGDPWDLLGVDFIDHL